MENQGLAGFPSGRFDNRTNRIYRDGGLALMQKIPTPITPVEIDSENRHITLAYFEEKSTVDYIGAVQGIPVCFDAKESSADTFALANIHPHQVDFCKAFEKQGGIAFFLIAYTHRDELYYLRLSELLIFWERSASGGRKSFRHDELTDEFFLPEKPGIPVPYLDLLQKDLDLRAEESVLL